MVIIPQKTLNWLLEENNPPVRNLTKKYLLDEEPAAAELKQVNDYEPIRSILSLMKPDGSWSDPKDPYKKYTGNYWQYIFLCDLNANPSDASIRKASKYILSYQLPDGGFSHKSSFKKHIICLTANLLRSLVYFGHEDEESVQKGINLITDQVTEHRGTFCFDPIYNLLPDCQMALTKVLALYAHLDRETRDPGVQRAINIIEERIAENRVFQYVPAGIEEFKKAIKGKRTAEIRQIKAKMSSQPENMKKTGVKSSWKIFGFPHSYTSDALETLYWLARLDVRDRSEYEEAINLVTSKIESNGFLINENKFKNKMLVDIEPKKTPSKWLTFRACYVSKKFRELKFEDQISA
ncbi:MAG: hypothetical protein ACFFD4_32905 [Candidatus Odinarchaeota archaeon]